MAVSKRPALLASITGIAIVALALFTFDVSANAILQAVVFSIALILLVAIPAAMLVILVKLIKHKRKEDKGKK